MLHLVVEACLAKLQVEASFREHQGLLLQPACTTVLTERTIQNQIDYRQPQSPDLSYYWNFRAVLRPHQSVPEERYSIPGLPKHASHLDRC